MHKVLSFGSLNIDHTYRVAHFVGAGETLAASEVQTFSGGKGLNQSIALAKAGAEVFHAGSIGKDGAFLLDTLKKAGVNTELVSVLEQEKTGHAIIQNTLDGENCILLYGGANRRVTEAQIDLALERFGPGDLLVLQNEINNIPYLIKSAKRKGMQIAFTPAPMQPEVRTYPLNEVDYLLLNETEAEALAAAEHGESMDANELADRLCAMFPGVHFVLTLGSAGALYGHKQEWIFQSAFPVKAVDTTAAGDTFTGYFLAGIGSGLQIPDALRRAAFAASIAVSRKGAADSIPTAEEISRAE